MYIYKKQKKNTNNIKQHKTDKERKQNREEGKSMG